MTTQAQKDRLAVIEAEREAEAKHRKESKTGGVYILTPAEEIQYGGQDRNSLMAELAERFGKHSGSVKTTIVRTSKGQSVGDFTSAKDAPVKPIPATGEKLYSSPIDPNTAPNRSR